MLCLCISYNKLYAGMEPLLVGITANFIIKAEANKLIS